MFPIIIRWKMFWNYLIPPAAAAQYATPTLKNCHPKILFHIVTLWLAVHLVFYLQIVNQWCCVVHRLMVYLHGVVFLVSQRWFFFFLFCCVEFLLLILFCFFELCSADRRTI